MQSRGFRFDCPAFRPWHSLVRCAAGVSWSGCGPPVAFVLGEGRLRGRGVCRLSFATGRDGQIAPITSRSGVPRPNRNIRKHRVLASSLKRDEASGKGGQSRSCGRPSSRLSHPRGRLGRGIKAAHPSGSRVCEGERLRFRELMATAVPSAWAA